jgi:AcrR family transcriptional regulator
MAVAIKTETKKHIDPRVLRTRKLLEQAFIELMNEKGFQDMTIQDITGRATVNRATFYAHFEDKYDMLDSFIRQYFNEVLADKAPLAPIYTEERLQQIIVTVMEFFAPIHKHCAPTDRQQVAPVFESAVQEELMKYLLDWFALAPPTLVPKGVNPQTAANVWSWAIFGAAFQWAQGGQKAPSGAIAREITMVLTAGCNSDQ